MEQKSDLVAGDVVLVVEGGWGLSSDNKDKYVELVKYCDYQERWWVRGYNCELINHEPDYAIDAETFGKNPMVLLNTKDKDGVTEEYTGSSSNYYKVYVKHPTTLPDSYEAECNDIIESLQMTFAEGNAFKAIWRKAKARQGVKKKGYDNGVYDSEKVVFFGERMLIEAKDGD